MKRQLDTQTVGCGGGGHDADGPELHPFISDATGPTGPCAFCELHRRWRASQAVCQQVLDALVEGRVVAAADGLRSWLATTSPQTKETP